MSIRDINKVCYPSTIPSNNMDLKLTFNVKEMSGKLPRQVLEDSYLYTKDNYLKVQLRVISCKSLTCGSLHTHVF